MRRMIMTQALLTATLLAAWAAPAGAYEWYKTDGGVPFSWWDQDLTYRIATVDPEEVAWSELPIVFEDAFGAWVDIPGCRVPEITYAGPATELTDVTTPTTLSEPTDNVMVFYRSSSAWTAKGFSPNWIAITLIANNDQTGQIVDADMAVNDGRFAFSATGPYTGGVLDLTCTLTHEAGHFLGMEHSADTDATMYDKYVAGGDPSAACSLEKDDIDGVCALYDALPACPYGCDDGDACTADSCDEANFTCVNAPIDGCGEDGGCGASAGGGDLGLGWIAALMALCGMTLLGRRRRRLHG